MQCRQGGITGMGGGYRHGAGQMTEVKEWLASTWLVLALSVAGGMARAAKCGERSLWAWFCSVLVALFAGVVTNLILVDLTSLPETARVACASVSAYSGGAVLDALQTRIADVLAALLGARRESQPTQGDDRGQDY